MEAELFHANGQTDRLRDRQTDRRRDMTELRVVFQNSENEPKTFRPTCFNETR